MQTRSRRAKNVKVKTKRETDRGRDRRTATVTEMDGQMDGEAKASSPGCGATYWRVQEV